MKDKYIPSVGDRVVIKSYAEMVGEFGETDGSVHIRGESIYFLREMGDQFGGLETTVATVMGVGSVRPRVILKDVNLWSWSPSMIRPIDEVVDVAVDGFISLIT